jgi:hypothetical protein
MSDRVPPDQPLGIEAISPPSVPPSDVPDEASQGEVARYEQGAKASKLTPTDRLCAEYDAHIRYLKEENSRLLEETKGLRARLDRVQPRYAALWQASRTNSLADVAALIGMAVGGGALSAASSDKVTFYKDSLFGFGVAVLLFGAAIMIYSRLRCWPKHREDDP